MAYNYGIKILNYSNRDLKEFSCLFRKGLHQNEMWTNTYDCVHGRLQVSNVTVVWLAEISSDGVDQEFPAARNFVDGGAVGVFVFVAAVFFRDAASIVALELAVARNISCKKIKT